MINITPTIDGFRMDEFIFTFEGKAEILSDYQAHVPTDRGIILVDTYMTINEEIFYNITDFLSKLYGE
jgi:hypothetical protein